MKWLEEPVNLAGTFGSRFSGAVAVPIFHVCMCTCLCEYVCVCMCAHKSHGCASVSVCDINVLRFGVCTCMCVCVNVRVALYFIVTLICGRLHQVSQDVVNLAGQTALEIDTHARVCV